VAGGNGLYRRSSEFSGMRDGPAEAGHYEHDMVVTDLYIPTEGDHHGEFGDHSDVARSSELSVFSVARFKSCHSRKDLPAYRKNLRKQAKLPS
jgi:hypothetical protein